MLVGRIAKRKQQQKFITDYELRSESQFSLPNKAGFEYETFRMMNILPSLGNNETLWHVEFRGYSAMDKVEARKS